MGIFSKKKPKIIPTEEGPSVSEQVSYEEGYVDERDINKDPNLGLPNLPEEVEYPGPRVVSKPTNPKPIVPLHPSQRPVAGQMQEEQTDEELEMEINKVKEKLAAKREEERIRREEEALVEARRQVEAHKPSIYNSDQTEAPGQSEVNITTDQVVGAIRELSNRLMLVESKLFRSGI